MAKARPWRYGPNESYAVQMLARHETILKLLADVAADMQVCALEGWDVWEYPRMIRDAIPKEKTE